MGKLQKLSPAIAPATAIALVLAGIVMLLWFERSYKHEKYDEVAAQARILAATVTAALTFNDHKAAQEYVNALAANPDIQIAGIYDSKGALFAGYSRLRGQPPPQTLPTAEAALQRGSLAMTAPVHQAATALGSVYVEAIADPIARRAARYAVIALLFTLAALVVAVLAAGQAALRGANAELARRADQLAAANLSLETQIAEREKVEEALRQAQKMEAVGQLTGGVAHDFNNLLQVITGNLDTLLRRAGDKEGDIRRLANAAMRGAERAAILTQRLLAFSRRQPLAPQPIEVNKLVAGMSDLLRRTLGETIRVETVLAGGVWRASADANQLENALLNLAVNARDAMPGGGSLTIETGNAYLDEEYAAAHEEVRAGQYVTVAVTDTGTGMTKETLGRVFEPFFTTKETGRGSGLGLSQVYGFMRQSDGHVTVYSELDQGTTVRLYLPRHLGAEASADTAVEAHPIVGADAEEVVLIVEDDEDVRINTVAMVRDLGYRVLDAENGQAALRVLGSQPSVRLLFTDIGLPGGLNGRQLADEARRIRPELVVLFTTGYARNAIVHHGRLDPGVEVIGKPFTYAALATKIRKVLDDAVGAAR
jgi:signal transduction histidine kinase/CheY-like chemotaxis protein